MLRLFALAVLSVVACHPPGSKSDQQVLQELGYLGPPPEPSEEAAAEPTPDAQEPAPKPRFELDPDFDIFEDEEFDSALGEPFTQEILDERVALIAPRVEELRGMKFLEPVPAGMQSADEFIEFALAEFDREIGMETYREMAEAYRMLGLIEPEVELFDTTMELLRGQVGGYYDPKSGSFYMIDSYKQGATADIILAHELTHALDDQHFDLQTLMEQADSADEEFAIRCVVEGSGTSLMNLYAIQGALAGWLELDPDALMVEMAGQAESLADAPPYLVMSLALPYMEGTRLLTRKPDLLTATVSRPTDADLRAAFANPPRSTEQVLHLEKYWDPAQVDEPVEVSIDFVLETLGEGWRIAHEDTLGELAAFTLTESNLPDLTTATGQLAGRWTNEAATGWGGDRYASCVGPKGERVLVWETVWDTETDAREFMQAFADKNGPGLRFVTAITMVNDQTIRIVCANDEGRTASMAFSPFETAGWGDDE